MGRKCGATAFGDELGEARAAHGDDGDLGSGEHTVGEDERQDEEDLRENGRLLIPANTNCAIRSKPVIAGRCVWYDMAMSRDEIPSPTDAERAVTGGEVGSGEVVAGEVVAGDAEAGASVGASVSPHVARYRLFELAGQPTIVCSNAPNIALRIEPGLTVVARGRRDYPPRTIFLDGVFAGAPFFDNEQQQYSLDHHAGCLRSATLATCEQAAVMLVQGLPLVSGDWTLVVNTPDLDALVAAWLLMNHVELLHEEAALLQTVMPFVHLEGIIDAHGLGKEVLCGLSPKDFERERQRLDVLIANERARSVSSGMTRDAALAFALHQLGELDRLLLPAATLSTLHAMHEAAWSRLGGGRLAILARAPQGIYEVEQHLIARYRELLAIIVLDKGHGAFTLKLVDSFHRQDLVPLYAALNRLDPNAQRGAAAESLWGGSASIGGSPRLSGSALSGEQVMAILARVYAEPEPWTRRVGRGLEWARARLRRR